MTTTYIEVNWVHSIPTEPVKLYSELNGDRKELRKIEVFGDGTITYACANEQTGDTTLSDEPLPTIEEIASDPQFRPHSIDGPEFERVWNKSTGTDSKKS